MLEIRLLGQFEIRRDGQLVHLPLRPAQALLAYLLLNPGLPHRREKLAGLFWPDLPETAARSNLRHALWRVRKALGAPPPAGRAYLLADEFTVAFGPETDLWLDTRVIEQSEETPTVGALMAAAEVYRGELLPGFYDDWVCVERERLQAVFESRMALLLDKLLAAEHWDEALAWGERWVGLGRAPEAGYRALIVAHGQRGDASQAAAAYRRCVEALQRELEIEPSAQTRAAYERAVKTPADAAKQGATPLPALRGYELRERIGSGGCGVVYAGYQPSVDRPVAIKVISPEHADRPDFIRRFEAEARLVARLEHPHIVPLYDYWREPGGAFLVMRWLKGGNLREAMRGGAWQPEAAARLVEQICAALMAAHRQGVVHRDVKPENILLDEAGNAYLSDFGIATALAGAPTAPLLARSAAYTSPELAAGGPATAQSDLYSLAVTLRAVCAPAPEAVQAVLAQAMDADPRQRYPSALAFADAFRRAAAGPPEAAERPEAENLANPYKGLRPFEAADETDFFGREALIDRLLCRMRAGEPLARFLAVIGPSGSGKSSVVKAGLLPALRRGALPGSDQWYVVEMTPGAHPLDELEIALLRVARERPAGLMEQLRRDARGLARAARLVLPDDDGQLLLVIDQFEEVFTRAVDPQEIDHLLGSLAAAASEPDGPVRALITLRADFYDRPLLHAAFSELIRARAEVVTPLTADELARAIRAPAERAGAEVEPDLEAALVADVMGQPGSLPMLEYALTEVFERRAGRRLTLDAYHALGGASRALARRADDVFTGLGAGEQDTARQAFLRLVMLGEGVEDTRRRVLLSELQSMAGAGGGLEAVLEAFGRHRLLTFDRDPATRTPTVELAHEALLREWGRLRGWLEESRAEVRQQRLLAHATKEWARAERNPSYLLRGARLAQFEEWAWGTRLALTGVEREYLAASVAEREQLQLEEQAREAREARLEARARSVLRALVGVFLAAAVVAGSLALWANTQRQAALRQAGILLAQQAENEVQYGNPDRAVLLALEALEQYPYTAQAEHALGQAVTLGRAERFLAGHTSAVEGAAWSPDGKHIATASVDETVRIWDTDTGQEVRRLEANNQVYTVAWSPDGSRLLYTTGDRFLYMRGDQGIDVFVWDIRQSAPITIYAAPSYPLNMETGTSEKLIQAVNANHSAAFSPDGQRLAFITDRTVAVWGLARGEAEFELTGHTDLVYNVAWSPDGRRLLTSGEDGTARIWDAVDGRALRTLSGHAESVTAALWSPDGRLVATSSRDGTLAVWDAADGRQLLRWEVDPEAVWNLAWSPDGGRLATANASGLVQVWEAESGQAAFTLRGHAHWATSVAWSPDGQHLVSTGHDTTVYIWKAAPGTEQLTLEDPSGSTSTVAWSPDSRQLLTAGGTWLEAGLMDGYVQLWDLATGQLVQRFEPAFDFFSQADWSPDGRHFVTRQIPGLHPTDDTILVWDAAQAEVVNIIPVVALPPFARDAAWSPDGRRIAAVTSNGQAYVYDAFTGEKLTAFTGHPAGNFLVDVAWSPDGQWLASAAGGGASENLVRIWNAQTGEERLRLEGFESGVNWVTWSPAGDRICTAAGDIEGGGASATVRIFDANTGQQQLLISGHTAGTWECGWSPNGRRLFSASLDGTTRVWDAITGAELLRLPTPTPFYLYAVWSPSGEYLATSGDSQPARVWRVWQSTQELLDYARECCVVRALTAEERERFGLPVAAP